MSGWLWNDAQGPFCDGSTRKTRLHGNAVIPGEGHSIGEEFVRTPEITRGAVSSGRKSMSYDI
jgi:hypothetical protein